MSKKIVDEQHSIDALYEMIKTRKKGTPTEEVLTIFCERYGLTMKACKEYYAELVKKGKIKE